MKPCEGYVLVDERDGEEAGRVHCNGCADTRAELAEAVRLLAITHNQGVASCKACAFVSSHAKDGL